MERKQQSFFKFFQTDPVSFGSFSFFGGVGYERGSQTEPAFAATKGGDTMKEPNRTQWEIRCAFNGFCKKAVRCEASNAHRDTRRRQLQEVSFSDLPPEEESQLFTTDRYFAEEEADDKSFFVAGLEITPKRLADAIHTLPEEKREAVLLYYFFDMSDAEIAKLLNLSRSTVQYRRTSSFELLKRYLEGRAYDEQ